MAENTTFLTYQILSHYHIVKYWSKWSLTEVAWELARLGLSRYLVEGRSPFTKVFCCESHLFKRVGPSIGRSVCPSVRRSVRRLVTRFVFDSVKKTSSRLQSPMKVIHERSHAHSRTRTCAWFATIGRTLAMLNCEWVVLCSNSNMGRLHQKKSD